MKNQFISSKQLIFIAFTLVLTPLFGQNLTETQWFFGNSPYNFQIDKNGDILYIEERMETPFGIGGSAVISDPVTGNLLFYSDGQQILDGEHNILSSSLSGNSAINQAAVASPLPGTDGQYLLFTNPGNSGVNEIQFSILDATASGNGNAGFPLGQIVSENNTTGLTEPSEGMIIIPDSSYQSFWLISQNRSTFDFNVTRIGANGPAATITYELDTITRPGFEASQFDYNADSSWLAVAPKTADRNVWILNFNRGSGELSFNRRFLNTGFNDGQGESIYDIEWAPNGNKLYLSRFGGSGTEGNVYQLDFLDSTETVREILPAPVFRSYGLKRAINDNIYHLFQENQGDPFSVGIINDPDSTADSLTYQTAIFEEDLNGRQFPAFAPRSTFSFDTLSFTWLDSCQNDFTKFFPIVKPAPTSYFWDFGPAGVSNQMSPIVQFDAPGGNFVRLTVSINDYDSTISIPVEIFSINDEELVVNADGAPGEDVIMPQDTTICIDEILRLTASLQSGNPAVAYVWSDGTIGPITEVDTSGTYWVEATLPNGCSLVSTFNITEYGSQEQTANQWYFGEMAGIDFNQQPPAAIVDNNMMFSPEGCATISDANGDLQFYTNGVTVWNREHEIMVGGTNIGGDSTAAQGVIILPFSDDETMYYIFTTDEVYGNGTYDMTYAIVDIKEDLGRGAVLLKGLPFFEKSIEKVTSTGFTGTYTLVTHEHGNNTFRANQISADGIGRPVFTPQGTVLRGSDPGYANGYMKFRPGAANFGNIIPGNGLFEIFDFVDSVGGSRMVNARTIDTEETGLYGLEFNADGNVAFISTANGIIGYRLDSLGTDDEVAEITSTKIIGPTGSNFGAIQRGPDGNIYLATDNIPSVQTISVNTDDIIALQPFDLQGRISRLGLPNFTQNIGTVTGGTGLLVEDACLGQDQIFRASGTSIIDFYEWEFGDSASPPFSTNLNGSTGDSVTVAYDTTGIFDVQVRIYNRCGQERDGRGPQRGQTLPPLPPPFSLDTTLTDQVEVFTVPDLPLVPDDTSLCNGPVVLTAWDEDNPDLSYFWSTGDTTRQITIFEPRQVSVSIVNSDGCSSDTIPTFIADGRPQIDLGPDQEVCQFEAVPDLDAQNTQVFYQWTINGNEANNTRFQPVSTDSTGSYEYAIRVQEPVNECVGTDTIAFNILETPNVLTDFASPSECGLTDGSVSIDITSQGNFLYSITNPDTSIADAVDGPISPPALQNVGIGTYNVRVENLVTGCSFNEGIFLEDDVPFDLTASNLPDCNAAVSLQLTLTGTSLPDRANIYVTNNSGDTVYNINNRVPPLLVSPELEDGEYFVTVTDSENGCAQVDSVFIQPLAAGPADCLPKIIAPNAFSPNGNGQNEQWYIIPNPYIDDFEVFIYNRWGELVYYANNVNFRWDGRYDNTELPLGTYAYVMKFTSLEDPGLGQQVQYGSVTLIR